MIPFPASLSLLAALAQTPAAAEGIKVFLKAGHKARSPQGAVLFRGSSSIALWHMIAKYCSKVPVVCGLGGSLIEGNALYGDRVGILYGPKIVVEPRTRLLTPAGKLKSSLLRADSLCFNAEGYQTDSPSSTRVSSRLPPGAASTAWTRSASRPEAYLSTSATNTMYPKELASSL